MTQLPIDPPQALYNAASVLDMLARQVKTQAEESGRWSDHTQVVYSRCLELALGLRNIATALESDSAGFIGLKLPRRSDDE